MLKCDVLKLEIIKLLKRKDMTMGELKRELKIAHHYTLTNALEFLRKVDILDIYDVKDRLKSKIVKIK